MEQGLSIFCGAVFLEKRAFDSLAVSEFIVLGEETEDAVTEEKLRTYWPAVPVLCVEKTAEAARSDVLTYFKSGSKRHLVRDVRLVDMTESLAGLIGAGVLDPHPRCGLVLEVFSPILMPPSEDRNRELFKLILGWCSGSYTIEETPQFWEAKINLEGLPGSSVYPRWRGAWVCCLIVSDSADGALNSLARSLCEYCFKLVEVEYCRPADLREWAYEDGSTPADAHPPFPDGAVSYGTLYAYPDSSGRKT